MKRRDLRRQLIDSILAVDLPRVVEIARYLISLGMEPTVHHAAAIGNISLLERMLTADSTLLGPTAAGGRWFMFHGMMPQPIVNGQASGFHWLGDGRIFVRFNLNEMINWFCFLPFGFTEITINFNTFICTVCFYLIFRQLVLGINYG